MKSSGNSRPSLGAGRFRGNGGLEESGWTFRKLLDSLPVPTYTCDREGLITSYNERAVEAWGRTPRLNDPADRFCGAYRLYDTDGTLLPPDRCWMALALRGDSECRGGEIIVEREDGTRRTVMENICPLHDHAGELIGAVNVIEDITDLRLAEQALRDADRKKDDFLALLAHELRNPLAPLRNALHLLSLDNNTETSRKRAQGMMERQVEQMVRLLDDLMDAARIARGKLVLQKERIDITNVVLNAIEDVRPLIQQSGHRLEVKLPPGPIYVDGDSVRLGQVFANLLTNAAKFMPAGGDIWVGAVQREEEFVVVVRDSGIGIPAEMLDRIFEPFTLVDSTEHRAHGGLGVGLSLARGMLELHGGGVDATSSGPGLGSAFTVVLPTLPSTEQPEAMPIPRIRRIPGVNRQRILVVEDNADSAISMVLMLELMGHEAKAANDGLAAMSLAEDFRPDVVLLDIGLPGVDGYELATMMREQPWGQRIFIIALTGWGHDEARRRAVAAGIDLHMVKPVEPAAVESLLAGLQRNIS